MKKQDGIENQAVMPGENKGIVVPAVQAGNDVKIRIKPNRSVDGLGAGGSEHIVDEATAKRLIQIGYAEIIA